MSTLPPRPYAISSRFVTRKLLIAVALFVLGVGSTIGAAIWTRYDVGLIHADQALWATGVYGIDTHVSGKETSHELIINSYELETQYSDRAGGAHTGKLSFQLLFTSISNGTPVEIKYDPANPERHTVSWAVDHVGSRYGFTAFIDVVFGGLFGLGMILVAVRQVRMLGDARRVAERSDEVALELVSVKPLIVNRKHAANIYRFRHTVGGVLKELKQQLSVKEEPLFTNDQRTHLVALVSAHAPERPWIMRVGYAPFEFPG